jgi:transposase
MSRFATSTGSSGGEASVRRLIGRFDDVGALRACYGAGLGGYELHRLLTCLGVACEVVAGSLIPQGSGGRIKTDRRDAARLARLYRAEELTGDPGAVAGGGGGARPGGFAVI